MLIKSIELCNFRQFFGTQKVFFSKDPEKNVTVIMGGNGSGKTSFAQAFTWCLYGSTDFVDKSMINHKVRDSMLPNESETVKVTLEITHNNRNYSVIRSQTYDKDIQGNVKPKNTQLVIAYKADDGQTEYIQPLHLDSELRKILPEELSRYFFFDGERIDAMSKEIGIGKSKEFANAVRSLLGLDAMEKAIEHLKSTSNRKSVIQQYNRSYDASADGRITDLTDDIERIDEELNSITSEVERLEAEESRGEIRRKDLETEIAKNADSENLARELKNTQKSILALESHKDLSTESMLDEFRRNSLSFFSTHLMEKALDLLNDNDQLDKGIPELHADTLNYLLERKKCLCGQEFEKNDSMYNELSSLLSFVPPESIGTMIRQFERDCKQKSASALNMFERIENNYKVVREFSNQYGQFEDDIVAIKDKLKNMKSVGHLQQELSSINSHLRGIGNKKKEQLVNQGRLDSEKTRKETARQDLVSKNRNNIKIETYKAYAEVLHEKLKEEYDIKEDETRKELEKTVNQIFQKIYDGGFFLTIDDKYTIQVNASSHVGFMGNIETSTAQSISIIFAFISGVIQMARDSKRGSEELLESEPYPLVMDAPLSAFDKTRIQTVCDVLPEVAEQVIIFIKDTDGEIAEEHLSDKIGLRYEFYKKDEFETNVEMRGEYV